MERVTNVVRVTEPARGGHFAAFELYVEEPRAFFRPYRGRPRGSAERLSPRLSP